MWRAIAKSKPLPPLLLVRRGSEALRRDGNQRRRCGTAGPGGRGPIRRFGSTGRGIIAVVDERPLRIEDLARRFESLPDYMAGSSRGDRRLMLSLQRFHSGRAEHMDEPRHGHGSKQYRAFRAPRLRSRILPATGIITKRPSLPNRFAASHPSSSTRSSTRRSRPKWAAACTPSLALQTGTPER
jgi:hypothetical protein